ncbi:MAG: hypothetical protein R2939_11090 [Kofleriaceae bacterium]
MTIWVPGPWRDPALLDWQRGGRVELRVFPIPAGGSCTIKLAYTQVATPRGDRRQYAYPLAASADASTAAERFSVDVEVRGARAGGVHAAGYDLAAVPADDGVARLRFTQGAFVPSGDLRISYQPEDADAEVRAWTFAGAAALAPDEVLAAKRKVGNDPVVVAAQRAIAADVRPTAVLALRPELPRWRQARDRDYVVVLDASESMVGERWRRAQALAQRLTGELDGRDRVTWMTCHDECAAAGPLAPASAAQTSTLTSWPRRATPRVAPRSGGGGARGRGVGAGRR